MVVNRAGGRARHHNVQAAWCRGSTRAADGALPLVDLLWRHAQRTAQVRGAAAGQALRQLAPRPAPPIRDRSAVGWGVSNVFKTRRGPTKRIVDGWPPGNTRLLQVMRAQLAALRRYSVERVAMVQWWEGHDWTRPRPGLRTRPRQNNCSLWVRAAPRAAAGHGALCSNELLPTPTVEH